MGPHEGHAVTNRRLALAMACVLVAAHAAPAGSDEAQDQFRAGQRWSYHTRPQEPDSTLVVGRVENHPKLGSVVHVSVFGLHMKDPQAPNGAGEVVAHLPLSIEALRDSVIAQVGEGEPAADFERGYATWRVARGGVFKTSVRDAVQQLEDELAKGR